MFADDKSIESLRQLFHECKTYLILQKRYVRLAATEKLSILLSGFILVLMVVILSMVALFYLSFTLAYLLETFLGGLIVSFALITLLQLLLIGLLIAFRRKLIIEPTVKFLAGLFLDDMEQETPSSTTTAS